MQYTGDLRRECRITQKVNAYHKKMKFPEEYHETNTRCEVKKVQPRFGDEPSTWLMWLHSAGHFGVSCLQT